MVSKLKIAFSLVELMVTLIIVSCIAAALAPAITKKLKSNTVSVLGAELKMTCDKFGPSCSLCYPDKCVTCTKSCLENQALNIPKCDCEDCATLHGANCIKCDTYNCSKCSLGYYVKNGKCEICPIGSYCNGTIKQICDSGFYTDSEGQSTCKPCEAGFICNAGIKEECSAGTHSEEKASSCLPCPEGYYCPSGIASECPSLTYNTAQGATSADSCLPCTANCTSCDKTTGVCSDCGPGFKPQGGLCIVSCTCQYGSCGAGSSSCTSCNGGYYLSGGSCHRCPAGYACPGGVSGKSACSGKTYATGGASSCTKCSLGICSSGICQAVDHKKENWCTECISSAYDLRDGRCYYK